MLKPETKQIQENLGDYCKLNHNEDIKGAKKDRLHHYRRLIYNIIDDALENAYPITRKQLNDSQWKQIVDEFVQEHPCQNPQLYLMPGELIEFAQKKDYATKFNLPFLIDMLNFEWVEVEVHSMKNEKLDSYVNEGDYLNDKLYFIPYFQLISLEYPIHRLKEIDIKNFKDVYFLLVYRQPNGTVQYTELNNLTTQIIHELYANDKSLLEALTPIIIGKVDEVRSSVINQSLDFIYKLKKLGVILGIAS